MGEVHRLLTPEPAFGLQAAGRLMIKIFPAWVQDLALLVESVEPVRPPGAARLPGQRGKTATANLAALCY